MLTEYPKHFSPTFDQPKRSATEEVQAVDQEPAAGPPVESLCGGGGFLTLTRHENEDIVIRVADYTILVRMMDISGNRSRIGVMADRAAVKVLRREIFDASRREKGA